MTRAMAAVGACAFIALGALSVGCGGARIGPGPRVQAGSGSAPKSTVYNQPVVTSMRLGESAVWQTPDIVPELTRVVPAIKAHR